MSNNEVNEVDGTDTEISADEEVERILILNSKRNELMNKVKLSKSQIELKGLTAIPTDNPLDILDRKRYAKCCVPNCATSKYTYPLLHFHNFPRYRLAVWIEKIEREFSSYSYEKKHKICSIHFSDKNFTNSFRSKLLKFAVPDIFDVSIYEKFFEKNNNYQYPSADVEDLLNSYLTLENEIEVSTSQDFQCDSSNSSQSFSPRNTDNDFSSTLDHHDATALNNKPIKVPIAEFFASTLNPRPVTFNNGFLNTDIKREACPSTQSAQTEYSLVESNETSVSFKESSDATVLNNSINKVSKAQFFASTNALPVESSNRVLIADIQQNLKENLNSIVEFPSCQERPTHESSRKRKTATEKKRMSRNTLSNPNKHQELASLVSCDSTIMSNELDVFSSNNSTLSRVECYSSSTTIVPSCIENEVQSFSQLFPNLPCEENHSTNVPGFSQRVYFHEEGISHSTYVSPKRKTVKATKKSVAASKLDGNEAFVCCVPNCSSKKLSNPNIHFFNFPSRKIIEWSNMIKGEFHNYIYQSGHKVCHLHFSDCYFSNSSFNRLKHSALPDVFTGK